MQSLDTNRWLRYAILLAILAVPFVYYDYFSLLCAPPVGTHIWRQTDSAAFAWCYWKNGLDFFHPQILNRTFGDGYAVSEFPILQYIIAIAYSLFGFHWWISKTVYAFVYLLGLIAIFRITRYYVQDWFWAYFMAVLFFTAPALVFYGNSCIPDVPALSFSLIGYACFIDFTEKDKSEYLWGSMFFFCLAGLMKLTYLLLFLAMLCVLIAEGIKKKEASGIKKLAWPFICVFAVNAAWLVWSDHYNAQNQYMYFLNKINPVWNESAEKAYIFKRTMTEWALRFFAAPTHYSWLLSLVILPLAWQKGNKSLSLLVLFLLLGSIAYYLLWYLQFLVHDYYTILFYAVYLFALLGLLALLQQISPVLLESKVFKILALALLVLNGLHVKKDLAVRYREADLYPADQYLLDKGLVPFMRSIGIKESDYVAVTTDGSPQIMLCALQNPGFTEFMIGKFDAEKLRAVKEKGAKYLLIIDADTYKVWMKDIGKPIGSYKQATVYEI